MKIGFNQSFQMRLGKYAFAGLMVLGFAALSFGQSNDQNNPTPIISNEIKGTIKARDIGDSRLTNFYYVFTGNRGDVFVNIVSNNINGTIDIFSFNGLKPRTKITLFADSPDSETGRVVYMRESERLVLRIQGRTPNDDPGTFQIKFAGSFVAETSVGENVGAPTVDGANSGSVRVNSVGTIISEPPPPAKSTRPSADSKAEIKPIPSGVPVEKKITESPPVRPANLPQTDSKSADSKTEEESITPEPDSSSETQVVELPGVGKATMELTVEFSDEKPKRSALVTISREPETEEVPVESTLEEKLAKVELRITLKNGGLFVRPMNEVLSMNVIKGVLTVVTNDGKIQEFSILDVANMTIE